MFQYPWNSPGKNTGVGCYSLLHRIFRTQGSSQCLLQGQCRQILYCMSRQGRESRVGFMYRSQPSWVLRVYLKGFLELPVLRSSGFLAKTSRFLLPQCWPGSSVCVCVCVCVPVEAAITPVTFRTSKHFLFPLCFPII